MRHHLLLLLLFLGLCYTDAWAQAKPKKTSKKTTKKVVKKAAPAPVSEEILLGKIATGKMTIKVHRAVEVFLEPCDKCLNSDSKYRPKPNHRVMLFEVSRRNANDYELNAQFENTTPLYARIIGTNGVEYPCYVVPSLVELAMEQKKIINAKKNYYELLGSAPARTEHRAFALGVEMPIDVQPVELIWKKETMLKCALNMNNNKRINPAKVVAETTVGGKNANGKHSVASAQ